MMTLSVSIMIALLVAVLVTGISKSGFAGGLGVTVVPFLSFTLPISEAIALMLPILIIIDMINVKTWWGKENRLLLYRVLFFGAIGVLVATSMFAMFDHALLNYFTGGIALLFGVYGLLSKSSRFIIGEKLGAMLSILAGVTSTLIHAGGPPINGYLMNLNLSKTQFLATVSMFFAGVNIFKLMPFLVLGNLNWHTFFIAISLSPVAFIGIKLGVLMQSKLNQQQFNLVINWLMIVLGGKLIIGEL